MSYYGADCMLSQEVTKVVGLAWWIHIPYVHILHFRWMYLIWHLNHSNEILGLLWEIVEIWYVESLLVC